MPDTTRAYGPCRYPDWEGERTVIVGEHVWKDGLCSVCGEVKMPDNDVVKRAEEWLYWDGDLNHDPNTDPAVPVRDLMAEVGRLERLAEAWKEYAELLRRKPAWTDMARQLQGDDLVAVREKIRRLTK